jgi:hypothetical protein
MANVLNNYPQTAITSADYFDALQTFSHSQRRTNETGKVLPWIDENLNPFTGDWISRTLLIQRKSTPTERGKDYNHSTFCDLIITGLVGLRPRADQTVEVNPLVPEGKWDFFCLDRINYHGKSLTILWDKTGNKYGRGTGFKVYADGKQIASADKLGKLSGKLE